MAEFAMVEGREDIPAGVRRYEFVDVQALEKRFRIQSLTAAEAMALHQKQQRMVQQPDKQWIEVTVRTEMRERAIAASVVNSQGQLLALTFHEDPAKSQAKFRELVGGWSNAATLELYEAIQKFNGGATAEVAKLGEDSGSSLNGASPSA